MQGLVIVFVLVIFRLVLSGVYWLVVFFVIYGVVGGDCNFSVLLLIVLEIYGFVIVIIIGGIVIYVFILLGWCVMCVGVYYGWIWIQFWLIRCCVDGGVSRGRNR